MVAKLAAWLAKSGGKYPNSKSEDPAEKSLGKFVVQQREVFKRQAETGGALTDTQRQTLEQLRAWTWDPRADQWKGAFERLKVFLQRTLGSTYPKKNSKDKDEAQLGEWVRAQRERQPTPERLEEKAAGLVSAEFASMLESLPGWTWRDGEA